MPIRGEASVDLAGGGRLTLAVNFATLARASAATKIPAQEMFTVLAVDDGRQLLAMLSLLEFALQKHHAGQFSPDDIGDMMLTDGEKIGQALGLALSGAFGEEEAGADASSNPPKAKRRAGTGTSSRSAGRKRA
jgi:hypothetical protein